MNKEIKILGVMSVYFPKLIDLERNIYSFIDNIDYLILWDNTPDQNFGLTELVHRVNSQKIIIQSTGKNEFLAHPFNICIKYAVENSFTHLLLMDQDSYFDPQSFANYKQQIIENLSTNIGIYTPLVNTNTLVSGGIQQLKFAYTSGSVIPVSVFEKVGLFREDLAMYSIDVEFSFRIRNCGFSIIRFNDVVLNHEMGYAIKNKLGFTINNYSALSTYYIIRNTLLLWKEYPWEFDKKDRVFFIKYKVIFRLLKMIFEKDKLKKTKAIVLGVVHGIKGRAGIYKFV